MKGIRYFSTILFVCSICCMQAAPVDTNTAQKVALTFMQSRPGCSGMQAKDIRLAFTSAQMNKDAVNAFYAFNVGEHGFVIVSADDRATPILAYSTTSALRPQLSPAARTVLDGYHGGIRDMAGQEASAVREKWDALVSGEPQVQAMATRGVEPLIRTRWGQSYPYNKFCPYDSAENALSLTGCGATAMAQLIAYWGWPVNGYGQCAYAHKKYGYMAADFSHAGYDFKNMPATLDLQSGKEQIDAVARLMYDCGISVAMDYSPQVSVSYLLEQHGGNYSIEYALRNCFGFVNGKAALRKDAPNTWQASVRKELDERRPLLFGGWSKDADVGHFYLCDGYDDQGMFHFNFGWNGDFDGFYLMDSIYIYRTNLQTIFNLMPPGMLNSHHIVLSGNITASADTISCDEAFTAGVRVQNNGNKPFFGEFRMVLENSSTKKIVTVFDTLSFLQDSLPADAEDSIVIHGKLKSLLTDNYNFRLQYRDTNETEWLNVSGIGNYTNIKSIRFDGGSTTTSLDSIYNITAHSAEVLGKLENACSETVIMKAIQYKKCSASSFTNVKDTSSGKTIRALLGKLEPGTSYDVQTYVMVQADATYKTYTSEKMTFTTDNADKVAASTEDGIRIWPNPTKGSIHIEAPEMPGSRICVINPLGQKIMESRLKDGQAELQLEHLAKGFYFIGIQNEQQKTVRKIILE